MDYAQAVLQVLRFIPKGLVTTYSDLSALFNGKISRRLGTYKEISPRQIGKWLHSNKDPNKYPCYKVVRADGTLASGYAFGGITAQKHKLAGEGISIQQAPNDTYHIKDLSKHLVRFSKIFTVFANLLVLYGDPGPWPWHNNQRHTKAEILIGAILTQNTKWKNADKALVNLKALLKTRTIGWGNIFTILNTPITTLEQTIRPAGYYRQKTKYLLNVLNFWQKNQLHRATASLKTVDTKEILKLRKRLLAIKGIGNETADTILLYVLDLPTFVIDTYTRRFTKYILQMPEIADSNYTKLQTYYEKQLSHYTNLGRLYQDLHALLVLWGKDNPKTALQNQLSVKGLT